MPSEDYSYSGPFDREKFVAAFETEFAKHPNVDRRDPAYPTALKGMDTLLGLIENDKRIADIRWVAYMLATVLIETATPKTYPVPILDAKGKPKLGPGGQPLMKTESRWTINMAPVNEIGHGKDKRYFLPVKVKGLPQKTAQVTEQDGDRFTVQANGKYKPEKPGATRGSDPHGAVSAAYTNDTGSELTFFGRGYVQLTWWDNYASTGAAIGRGLELLFDPTSVLQPQIAYQLMSHGMISGEGFANGHKLADYFDAKHTDYVNARAIVNGHNRDKEIAGYAQQFEKVLLSARAAPTPVA